MLTGIFGWLIVAYFAAIALWLVGGTIWGLLEMVWDDVIPGIQGRRARARRLTVERSARVPRRVDLRDSEAVGMWLDRLPQR